MKTDVTKTLTAAWRAVGLAVLMSSILAGSAAAQTPPKHVRIAIGTRVINITYPWLTMPGVLGYWKQEGLDVELLPIGGSLEAVQQMVGGNVDFVQINSSVIVQANANNNIPLRAVMLNTVNDWSVVALDGGPIKDIRDFKGKSIGVPSLSSGGVPILQMYLRANGLEPDSDVDLVAVGFGAPALQALRADKVQGLMFFQSMLTGFENVGAKFRYFHGDDWRQQPDFALVTLQKTIDRDPAMVEAIVRGATKADVFAFANPACVRKLQWAHYPDSKPSGAPDEAAQIKWDLNLLAAQMTGMKQAYELSGGKLWGDYTLAEANTLQDFMLASKQIDKKLPPATFITGAPDFFARTNQFDPAPIKAAAESCAVD
jgi:NitT/TauT family transport system substrate-binding protein